MRLAQRRSLIAELLLQGKTYREIANAVRVKSTRSVFEDVKAVIAEWKAQQQHHVSEWIALELERIGRIEAKAWEAWERSCQNAEIHLEETGPNGDKVRDVSKGQSGNPGFLDIILKCVQRRCELLGLDEPKEVNVPGLLTPEEIERRRQVRYEKVMPVLAAALTAGAGPESVGNA